MPRRRSPDLEARLEKTAAAAEALRERTAENWRLFPDPEVGTVLWADFTAGVDALPARLRVGSPHAAVRTFFEAHEGLWGGPMPGSSLRELWRKTRPDGGVHIFYQQV